MEKAEVGPDGGSADNGNSLSPPPEDAETNAELEESLPDNKKETKATIRVT